MNHSSCRREGIHILNGFVYVTSITIISLLLLSPSFATPTSTNKEISKVIDKKESTEQSQRKNDVNLDKLQPEENNLTEIDIAEKSANNETQSKAEIAKTKENPDSSDKIIKTDLKDLSSGDAAIKDIKPTSINRSEINSTEKVIKEIDDKKLIEKEESTAVEVSSNIPTVTNRSESITNQTSVQSKCELPEKNYFFIPLYVFICAYSFLGIAVTCHYYFLPSLTRVCEELKMSEDVVGATFMAAGSSAPELATVVIAVFFTKDDIGISDVIGSAVFNMMFVIAMCGFFTTTPVKLNWWPMCRNCFFYVLSVFGMLIAIYNGKVTWFESLILIVLYILYCVALYHNKLLEAWAHTLPLPFNKLIGDIEIPQMEENHINIQDQKVTGYYAVNATNNDLIQSPEWCKSTQDTTDQEETDERPEEESFGSLEKNANIWECVKWYILYPIRYVCYITIPNCKLKKWQNCYLFTFAMSMIWISLYSYLLIWMIELIGLTLKIPDTVMGLTLMAAGVSVPDAITSIDVVKKGYGDMGVSNAIGSNIFDILMCLGLPWFLKTAIISPGTYVAVYSKGMIYSTLLLFSSAVLLIATAHCNNWKLDRKFGSVLMVGYFCFITIASIYELVGYQNVYCL